MGARPIAFMSASRENRRPKAKSGQGSPPSPQDYRVISARGVKDSVGHWEDELNSAGHAVIHDKILVVDPFTDNCVVVTGSHNLGYTASYNNDENMAVIRGHRALAEAYAAHVLDIYDHYAWRYWLEQKNYDAGVDVSHAQRCLAGQLFRRQQHGQIRRAEFLAVGFALNRGIADAGRPRHGDTSRAGGAETGGRHFTGDPARAKRTASAARKARPAKRRAKRATVAAKRTAAKGRRKPATRKRTKR